MLIGAHVSPSGGLYKAVERGVEIGCESIQIFNQSPRMWRPTAYGPDDFAAFREAFTASPLQSVVIHAVYLINCASEDPDLREKSLASLIHSLRVGDGIGAAGVVLHAGSAKGGSVPEAIARAGEVIREALAESERCQVHLEDTAGAGGTLGRSFDELAALIDAASSSERVGLCLDSCHLLASGYEVRTRDQLADTLDLCDRIVGLDRLASLHVNDSAAPLGSNRDRHAKLGEGEFGEKGLAVFLSEPRFDGLPCVLETEATAEQVAIARRLYARGRAARKRAARSGAGS